MIHKPFLVFYLKTGKLFPRGKTQGLDNTQKRKRYESRVAPTHEFYRGKSIEDYDNIIKKYVINVR